MSETEHNKGVLIPIEIIDDLENTAGKILKDMGEAPEEYYGTFLEQLEDIGYRNFFITDDVIYRVENEGVDTEEDIMLAKAGENGRIYYETKFYNGGCSFNEALEGAIKNIGKESL